MSEVSSGDEISREPTEEEINEMRAAYEEELKRIAVIDVVIQTAVSLINLAGRRLSQGVDGEDERDLEQARDAIDAVRGLMPVLERRTADELGPLRDALSQLQLAYAREAQTQAPTAGPAPAPPAGSAASGPAAPQPGGPRPADADDTKPGPAESSGRLWVPGR
jgi:hypothetical protein